MCNIKLIKKIINNINLICSTYYTFSFSAVAVFLPSRRRRRRVDPIAQGTVFPSASSCSDCCCCRRRCLLWLEGACSGGGGAAPCPAAAFTRGLRLRLGAAGGREPRGMEEH